MKENAKKIGWGFLALLSCPCHLVLILPLLAGTTFGAYFALHQTAVSVILGIVFVISLVMMFKRASKQAKTDESHDCCSVPERK
ncbi:transporter [Paenibacillus sp. 11B]|uniref:Transporter n=1 Tax=Paenibacillus urinalis TaxID=521520 RepID=A0AAX3N7C9_9BACL|nr:MULTISPECIES: transporter [Paenibacillus]MDN8593155.1 transporter [Paenibacillus sp. 11B]WDH85261.1 transporter [Paenibacillus urinalis]